MRNRFLLRCLAVALGAAALSGCAFLHEHLPWLPGEKPAAAPAVKPVPPPAAKPVPVPPPAAPAPLPVKPAPPPLQAKPPALPLPNTPPAVSAADRAYADGRKALKEGNLERALEWFSIAWKEKPDHPGVAQEFHGALTGLKNSGDTAYAEGKLEDAGKRWMATLHYMSHPAARQKNLPFTRAEVQAEVDQLSARLMDRGLMAYRKGQIPAAIADWKVILAYDPSHKEAAKSIRTATTQLENLKKLPPKR